MCCLGRMLVDCNKYMIGAAQNAKKLRLQPMCGQSWPGLAKFNSSENVLICIAQIMRYWIVLYTHDANCILLKLYYLTQLYWLPCLLVVAGRSSLLDHYTVANTHNYMCLPKFCHRWPKLLDLLAMKRSGNLSSLLAYQSGSGARKRHSANLEYCKVAS